MRLSVFNFAYLPIRRGSKKPAVKGWNKPEAATYDKSEIHGNLVFFRNTYMSDADRYAEASEFAERMIDQGFVVECHSSDEVD